MADQELLEIQATGAEFLETDPNSYNLKVIKRLSSEMKGKLQFAMKIESHDRRHRI